MHRPRPALIIVPLLLIVLAIISYVVEGQRSRERSALSGFFESQPTEVASRVQGRVHAIRIKEGDAVHAGDTLVELETQSLSQDAQARMDQAEQSMQQLKEVENGPRSQEIRKQEGVLAEAQDDLAKLINGPLPEEISESRARLQHAEAQYQKVKDGPRPQEIAQARAAERDSNAKLAAAERGLTPEERAEAKARLDQAVSQEEFAKKDADRYAELFREDAVSRQQAEQKMTDYQTAQAKRREMESAWKLADIGTPKEEMEQARQAHQQTVAALNLLLAGSRQEDIASAKADAAEARKALQLLLRGSRAEDIRAGRARVASARAALDELLAGSRIEDIRQAKKAAAAAINNAKSARTNLLENAVKAPIDGVVERVPIAVGDLVNPGTTLVRLTNPSDLWLRVYVPEANLHGVSVGAAAKLRIDGVTGELLAVVESVSTQGEFTPANLQTPDDRGKQVFGVRLRLSAPHARVKPGMAATVTRIGTWTP